MKKFKVYLPSGVVQTIIANEFAVQWVEDGVGILRFTVKDSTTAIFPPGGWHGVQDMEIYKQVVV